MHKRVETKSKPLMCIIVPVMQVRCASCRGLCSVALVCRGGLRRGARGNVLLWGMVGARMVHVGEGIQEGHALIFLRRPPDKFGPSRPAARGKSPGRGTEAIFAS